LFVFTAGEDSAPLDLPGQKALLRARYGDGRDQSVSYSGRRKICVRPRNYGYSAAPAIFLGRGFRLSAAADH
jgi:hypothetical protein